MSASTFNCLRCRCETAVPDIRKSDGLCDSCNSGPPDGREAYEPHCVMAWREQMAGMDDMGGVDTALARGDAT